MMLVLVLALAIAPTSSTLCAALCAPIGQTSQPSDTREPSTNCHGQSDGIRPAWSSTGHDCGNHGAVSHEARVSLTAARADDGLVPALHVVGGFDRSLPAIQLYRSRVSASPPARPVSTSDGSAALRI
jgi:hypothetical protein